MIFALSHENFPRLVDFASHFKTIKSTTKLLSPQLPKCLSGSITFGGSSSFLVLSFHHFFSLSRHLRRSKTKKMFARFSLLPNPSLTNAMSADHVIFIYLHSRWDKQSEERFEF